MPSSLDPLPRFRLPPVDEVAVGIQFALPGLLPTHYGAFYDRVKSEFPGVQALAPLPPIGEVFAAQDRTVNLGMSPLAQFASGWPPWPRALFVSTDDCSVIQLQRDRLYFNWRHRPEQAEKKYRHYEHLRDGFSKAYGVLEALATEQSLGSIDPSMCEISYVNPLPLAVTGVGPSTPEEMFRVWSADVGKEWRAPLEDLAFVARYPFLDDAAKPFGRLTANMSTVVGQANVPQMRLELTARGMPRGVGLDGVLAFHDIGHAAIVRCFAAITTPAMHARWERYQ